MLRRPFSHQSIKIPSHKTLPVPQQDIANRDRRTLEIDLDDVAAVSDPRERRRERESGREGESNSHSRAEEERARWRQKNGSNVDVDVDALNLTRTPTSSPLVPTLLDPIPKNCSTPRTVSSPRKPRPTPGVTRASQPRPPTPRCRRQRAAICPTTSLTSCSAR